MFYHVMVYSTLLAPCQESVAPPPLRWVWTEPSWLWNIASPLMPLLEYSTIANRDLAPFLSYGIQQLMFFYHYCPSVISEHEKILKFRFCFLFLKTRSIWTSIQQLIKKHCFIYPSVQLIFCINYDRYI